MSISCIGVVGAGQMGGGIAQVAARSGLEVVLHDITRERADAGRSDIAKRAKMVFVDVGRNDVPNRAVTDLRIEEVPGDHGTMNTGKNLKILAHKLTGFLKQARHT